VVYPVVPFLISRVHISGLPYKVIIYLEANSTPERSPTLRPISLVNIWFTVTLRGVWNERIWR